MSSDRTKIQGLMQRWRKKTNQPMPLDIASLPLDRIESAVRHIEAGNIVVVPKGLSLGEPRHATEFGEDSMMEDDAHGRY
jgi:hypothetical protein